MTRRSLQDRNRDAIAIDPEGAKPEDSTETRSAAEPASQMTPPKAAKRPEKLTTRPGTPERPATARKGSTAAASETARLGIYLTPAEFDDGKAAYLADWTNGGVADTFARWIAAAMDAYAARTPKQRATAQPRGRAVERTGSTRSFSIPTDTVARMRAAINADQQGGRWPSDSAWCGEAIAFAVDAARTENKGTLPTPPARLPNRLVR